jgi:branched-chain amino acid transport system substrate-binding protein
VGFRFGRGLRVAVAAVALATIGGACSSSSSKTTSTTAAGGPPTTTAAPSASPTTAGGAATGSPLHIGAIADETGGCLPTNTQDQAKTLAAWQAYVNSHGGVAGHPVAVTVIDTKCDPGNTAAAGQSLIAAHVLAIIDGTGLDSAFQKEVDAAKIPVLCGIENGNGFTCQSDPNFFPSGSTVVVGLYGQALAAKQAGANSYGIVYCSEVAACKQALPLQKTYAQQVGLKWVPPISASLSAPNYTAQCVAMQEAKAQALFGAGPPSQKLADDCARQGYHPIYVQGAGTWQTQYLKDPNLNNTTGETTDIPWFYQGPQTATFHAAEDSVLNSTNFPYNVSSTYAAALLFQTALAKAGASPTTQDLYTSLYAMHNETLGGYAPPLNYSQGKPTVISCFFVVSIKNGAFTAPHGASYQCQSAASTTPSS